MVIERLPAGRGKADVPARLGLVGEATGGEIVTRLRCGGGLQLQPVELDGLLHDLGQLRAVVGLFLRLWIARGHLHTGFARYQFDRLHEADVFGFLHEGKQIALRVTAETIVEALPVIDVEGGGFFLVEGAWPHVALALVRLALVPHDLAAHDLGQRGAGAQFIDETGGQTHGLNIGLGCARV